MVRDQLTGIAQQVESKTRHMCKGDRSLRTAEGLFPATRQMAVAIHMDSLNVAPPRTKPSRFSLFLRV